ncbi:MAG: hypothetical protein FWC10_10610 [Lentimicrobiaceae bacterium]|nr:hypothetical protein [Lentimicrobiaceae bacterium]
MRTTFTTFILLFSLCLQAQEIKWQAEAKRTFVYEITNSEAEQFLNYSSKDSLAIKKMLHTPRGYFSGKWKEEPNQGHFIFVEIDKGKVSYRYTAIIPFKVFHFQEYGALTIQVIDAQNNLRDDAKLLMRRPGYFKRWKNIPVPFDKKTRTYTIGGSHVEDTEFLMIELDNFCALFEVSKTNIVPRYGSYNSNYYNSPKFYSYLITDKNRYKPGETIRFKSYSLYGIEEEVTPLKYPLELWMQTDY